VPSTQFPFILEHSSQTTPLCGNPSPPAPLAGSELVPTGKPHRSMAGMLHATLDGLVPSRAAGAWTWLTRSNLTNPICVAGATRTHHAPDCPPPHRRDVLQVAFHTIYNSSSHGAFGFAPSHARLSIYRIYHAFPSLVRFIADNSHYRATTQEDVTAPHRAIVSVYGRTWVAAFARTVVDMPGVTLSGVYISVRMAVTWR